MKSGAILVLVALLLMISSSQAMPFGLDGVANWFLFRSEKEESNPPSQDKGYQDYVLEGDIQIAGMDEFYAILNLSSNDSLNYGSIACDHYGCTGPRCDICHLFTTEYIKHSNKLYCTQCWRFSVNHNIAAPLTLIERNWGTREYANW